MRRSFPVAPVPLGAPCVGSLGVAEATTAADQNARWPRRPSVRLTSSSDGRRARRVDPPRAAPVRAARSRRRAHRRPLAARRDRPRAVSRRRAGHRDRRVVAPAGRARAPTRQWVGPAFRSRRTRLSAWRLLDLPRRPERGCKPPRGHDLVHPSRRDLPRILSKRGRSCARRRFGGRVASARSRSRSRSSLNPTSRNTRLVAATKPSPISTSARISPVPPPISAAQAVPAITSSPAQPNDAIRDRLLIAATRAERRPPGRRRPLFHEPLAPLAYSLSVGRCQSGRSVREPRTVRPGHWPAKRAASHSASLGVDKGTSRPTDRSWC